MRSTGLLADGDATHVNTLAALLLRLRHELPYACATTEYLTGTLGCWHLARHFQVSCHQLRDPFPVNRELNLPLGLERGPYDHPVSLR